MVAEVVVDVAQGVPGRRFGGRHVLLGQACDGLFAVGDGVGVPAEQGVVPGDGGEFPGVAGRVADVEVVAESGQEMPQSIVVFTKLAVVVVDASLLV
ncbi:hypothetical protein [Nonomuraea sp. KM90]|uniref:hypothetical protein n=1 Tax=Nonomuraea sp. KM90 TaxID=3457428 RepID=UPI003FCCEDF8